MRSRALLAAASLLLSIGAYGQNLVTGGGFASSLEAWHHDPNANGSSAWSDQDASGSSSSGSALLASTGPEAGLVALLEQCVPVAAGQSYVLAHKARFVEGALSGWAETAANWNSGPVCTGFISESRISTFKASSESVWIATSDTFTAPAGALSALVLVGIDKIQDGFPLAAWFDDVSLAPAAASSDLIRGWLPVVGSLPGNFGATFRTSLKILNPGTSPLSGRLLFHPAGQPASDADPSMGYSLAPGQSFAWHDVVAAMGLSGLGSMDVTGDSNFPAVVTRIFDDAGDAGTSGFTVPLFLAEPQGVPPIPSLVGHLLLPDLGRYRYNVGIRILQAPVDVTVDVLDPGGTVVHTVTRTYAQATFQQTGADDFAGVPLVNDQNLRVTASPFYVIVYGATVDNVTNDPSAQFLTHFSPLQP